MEDILASWKDIVIAEWTDIIEQSMKGMGFTPIHE